MTTGQTNEVKSTFEENGYYFPIDVLDEATAALYLAELRKYQQVCEQVGGAIGQKWNSFKIHLLTAWADRLVHNEKLLDVVSGIIGDNMLVWSTSIFLRQGGSTQELAWHRDLPNHGWDGFADHAVRVWLALTETTTDNGTMRFLQGSHLPSPSAAHSDGNGITWGTEATGEYQDAEEVAVLLRPGQASLHQPLIVHSSGPSTADSDRVCFAIDYITPEVTPTNGVDGALLVRGEDTHGHFWAESRAEGDFHPDAIRHFQEAVAVRERYLFSSLRRK